MSELSWRKRPSPKAATKKRLDQRSDPKLRYKIRRKIPAPSLHKHEGNGKLNDEQLAMPFVVPKRIEAQPFLKWVMEFANDRVQYEPRGQHPGELEAVGESCREHDDCRDAISLNEGRVCMRRRW